MPIGVLTHKNSLISKESYSLIVPKQFLIQIPPWTVDHRFFFLSYFFLIIFWRFLTPLSYFFIIFLSLRFFYHIFISYFEIPKIFIISLSYYFEMLKKSYHIFLSYFFIFKLSYHIFWLIYIIFLDFWKYDINMIKKKTYGWDSSKLQHFGRSFFLRF